jgi:hypothetical protein
MCAVAPSRSSASARNARGRDGGEISGGNSSRLIAMGRALRSFVPISNLMV